MALTKKDIVEQVQKQLGFQKNKYAELTETLLDTIKSTLESSEDVLVSGFGKILCPAQTQKERPQSSHRK